ncbi:MAG: KdsC family phosphatase [Thermoanaerobaculia bacterium]
MLHDDEVARRAAALEWLLLDVDGVLTDGRLLYSRSGESLKQFHVRDGLAVRLAAQAGLKVGVLSGRASAALARRASDLGFDAVMTGRKDKGPAFAEFLERYGTDGERVAYIGDDLPDLEVLGRCGLALAPADAVPEVRAAVHRVLQHRGGDGAVREAVELILKARGDWDQILAGYTV